jgi:hypothetical protein
MAKRFDYVATQCLGCRYAIYQGACTHPDVDQDDFVSAANDACRLFTADYPRPRTVSGTECGIVPVAAYETLQTDLAAATARAEAAEAALAVVFAEMEAEEKRLAALKKENQ